MPELPEVETTARGIRPWLEKKVIEQVKVHHSGLRWPVPENLEQALQGQRIEGILRRGKYLILQTPANDVLIHLGMSGSLRVDTDDSPRRKHDHIEWLLPDAVLRFHDPRRFGSVLLAENGLQHPLIAPLGPEPLGCEFDGDYLFDRSRRRSQAVKNFIMDSKVVVGVGNIYASEALFRAGIWPQATAGRLSRSSYQRLAAAIKETLEQAIAAGGTTLQDFVNAAGEPGYFAQSLQVYGRAGQPCVRCQRPVQKRVIGQRSSFFCSRCQRTGYRKVGG